MEDSVQVMATLASYICAEPSRWHVPFLQVPHADVASYKWFLGLITELEHEIFKQKLRANTESAQQDWSRYSCKIHLFVTRAPPVVQSIIVEPPQVEEHPFSVERLYNKIIKPIFVKQKSVPCDPNKVEYQFTMEQLYKEMANPSVDSALMSQTMSQAEHASNNMQDVWVWKGRPDWEQIFTEAREQAIDTDVGVFVSTGIICCSKL